MVKKNWVKTRVGAVNRTDKIGFILRKYHTPFKAGSKVVKARARIYHILDGKPKHTTPINFSSHKEADTWAEEFMRGN